MISEKRAVAMAAELMLAFSERTGLGSPAPARRYLWTDAFAVCNFFALARATGDERYADLALRLVDQVHRVLGRHRHDAPRAGWLCGLGDDEGAAHPTLGGLRIGKRLPERGPGEPADERLEWDRDGQYFHYLTKWMHALDQTARATSQPRFNLWARELAATAHRAFTAPVGRRMVWKMSVDLSRPLVASMGQHDPLDGLLTALQLQATAAELGNAAIGPDMSEVAADFAAMIAGQDLATPDPLGLGGLLADAGRAQQLVARHALADGTLLDRLLAAALTGLPHFVAGGDVRAPASRRLAFRELGLAIGLRALAALRAAQPETPGGRAQTLVTALSRYEPVADAIGGFWLDAAHRDNSTWAEHRDINEVMLATSLTPDGFLTLSPARRS